MFAVRRVWPDNGTGRAHCGKYYRILLRGAIMAGQSHPGAYQALMVCQNSQCFSSLTPVWWRRRSRYQTQLFREFLSRPPDVCSPSKFLSSKRNASNAEIILHLFSSKLRVESLNRLSVFCPSTFLPNPPCARARRTEPVMTRRGAHARLHVLYFIIS